MINSEDTTQLISLSRDCEVISVPYGEKEILKEGTEVQIMQALGGSYTVYTVEGMFRINGTNADAIGKEVEKPPSLPENITDDEFEEKVWDQMKTVNSFHLIPYFLFKLIVCDILWKRGWFLHLFTNGICIGAIDSKHSLDSIDRVRTT